MPALVHRRIGLAVFYSLMAFVFLCLGLLFLVAGLGRAVDPEPWSHKWLGTIGFVLAGLTWLGGINRMVELGRSYFKNEVRLSDEQFFLRTPGGAEIAFPLSDLRQATWDGRVCTIQTAKIQYRFDRRTCPRAPKIAHHLQNWCQTPIS